MTRKGTIPSSRIKNLGEVIMTRDEAKTAIKTMQAYVGGAEIEVLLPEAREWRISKSPFKNFGSCQYRVHDGQTSAQGGHDA